MTTAQTPRERVAVIYNPHSAHGRTGRRWPQLEAAIRAQLGAVEVFATNAPRHATALAQAALRSGCTRVISVGGDGTHFEVANGFFNDDVAINPAAVLDVQSGAAVDLGVDAFVPGDFTTPGSSVG